MKFYLLFLMGMTRISSLWCFNCPLHSEGETCICDNRTTGTYAGSEIVCMDSKSLVNSYVIEYAVNRRVRLECNAYIPYKIGMFSQYNITEITNFHFVNCPLPNITFEKLLQGMQVVQLKFESRRTDLVVAPWLFENLKELSTLSLVKNGISILSDNMFSNLSTLRTLQLSDNNLQNIPEKVFTSLHNLATLDLSSNKIKELPNNVFHNLTHLHNLYLFKNELQHLPDELFHGLEQLVVLDISRNKFSELSVDLFNGLSSLESLRISQNNLKTLPESILQNVPNLKVLNLVLNENLTYLPDKLLNGLEHLQSVFLDYCNLSKIPVHFFSNTSTLQHLKISNNKLTSLSKMHFVSNIHLKELDLSSNKLRSLPSALLAKQFALEKLNLKRNRLEQLPMRIFDSLVSLKTLIISSNQLKGIKGEHFINLQKLEHLDLSHNRISSIDSKGALGNILNLKTFDLSYNNITLFPNLDWKMLLQLDTLNFQYNRITNISVPVLYSKNTRVLLRFNKISRVEVTELKRYDSLQKHIPKDNYTRSIPQYPGTPSFFLSANPIHCDCNLLGFFDYLTFRSLDRKNAIFPNANLIKCAGPSSLAGKEFLDVPRNEFICPVFRDCPIPCACHIQGHDKTVKVDCRSRYLDAIPEILPQNTSILYLQNNSISSLGGAVINSTYFSSLKELHLDYNLLSNKIDWFLPPNLHVLTLRGNKLESLPESLLGHKSSSTNKLELRLGKNQWRCDCSSLPFKSWLRNSQNIVSDIQDIVCSDPMQINGSMIQMSMILNIPDEVLCPKDKPNHHIILISVSTVCAFLVLLFCVIVVYFQGRKILCNHVITGKSYNVSNSRVLKDEVKNQDKASPS
ncbi:uncharacterized protein LOC143236868 [Tachypleus tridentatus]|uniref:uncharacterized protein LOC143236868 n=1 Tax=Tachypleus tridentatus TaxID=6853 RepID=UPI003FD1CB16